jgi:hypothetical protein
MKIGGGGREQFMVMLPLLVAAFMTVYALGGPDRTFALLERMTYQIWGLIQNALK